MYKARGFNLSQLMIAVSIIGISASLAIPSFNNSIRNRKLNGIVETLRSDLQLARTEAVKRNSQVTICKSNNRTSCSGTWSDGWITFADRNGNHNIDAGETLIQSTLGQVGDYTLTWTAFISNNYLKFDPTGLTNQNGTFKLCPSDNNLTYAKLLIVSKLSRIRYSRASDTFQCP